MDTLVCILQFWWRQPESPLEAWNPRWLWAWWTPSRSTCKDRRPWNESSGKRNILSPVYQHPGVRFWQNVHKKQGNRISGVTSMASYLARIFETHPLDTWSILEMSQGRAPEWASSTIFWRVESGNGLPFTYTPPSWLIPLWPGRDTAKLAIRGHQFVSGNSPCENLGHTAIGHLENTRDVAGPDTRMSHFDDLMANVIGEGPPVHVHAPKLVHTRPAWNDSQSALDTQLHLHHLWYTFFFF